MRLEYTRPSVARPKFVRAVRVFSARRSWLRAQRALSVAEASGGGVLERTRLDEAAASWIRAVLGLVLLVGACAADVPAPAPAPDVARWSDYGEPSDPQLWAAVVARWDAAGFPDASECALPREVFADALMVEEICGAGGASGCQRPGLIVIGELSRDHDDTRAHEMGHWLVECTGAGSARENRAHLLEGIWFESASVTGPWVSP